MYDGRIIKVSEGAAVIQVKTFWSCCEEMKECEREEERVIKT